MGERWVPTFPNALHIFSARERAYSAALSAGDGSDAAIRADANLGRMVGVPGPGVYEVSLLPVIEAGLTREILVNGQEGSKAPPICRAPATALTTPASASPRRASTRYSGET